MTKLSIVVPIYNTEKYLRKCVDSLLAQDVDDYEIILVNDSTPDNSQDIIDEYVEKYPDIVKSYIKENGGLGDTRNYGMSKASGEFIFFVDSDDYIKENSLGGLVNRMHDNNLDVLVFDFMRVDDKGNCAQLHTLKEIGVDKINSKNYILSTPNACNKMFRTSLFIDNNVLFPTRIWYEDFAVVPGLAKYTDRIDYVNEGVYYYLYRGDSIMNQMAYNPKILDMIDSATNLESYIKEDFHEEMEFLSLHHLFYGSSLKLIPFKKYDELKQCIEAHEKKYPLWQNNKYYNAKPLLFKLYCSMLSKRRFLACRVLLKVREVLN